ncbi:MAG: tRNA (adenosine(37)-N6)-dimethylallyltransferase MiaA, partial [Nitrospira sp.]
LKRDTRHFAKRQLTWFRKEPGLRWYELTEQDRSEDVAGRLLEEIGSFLRDPARRRPADMPRPSLNMEQESTA